MHVKINVQPVKLIKTGPRFYSISRASSWSLLQVLFDCYIRNSRYLYRELTYLHAGILLSWHRGKLFLTIMIIPSGLCNVVSSTSTVLNYMSKNTCAFKKLLTVYVYIKKYCHQSVGC